MHAEAGCDAAHRVAVLERVEHPVSRQDDQVLADLQQVRITQAIGGHDGFRADAEPRRKHPQRVAILDRVRYRLRRLGRRDPVLQHVGVGLRRRRRSRIERLRFRCDGIGNNAGSRLGG